MSSPLSMLKKHKRPPLPGLSSRGMGSNALRGPMFTGQDPGQDLLNSELCRPSPMSHTSLNKEAPPSDLELMSTMMERLTQLEVKVRSQAQDLEVKEKKIMNLERKLNLTEAKKDVNDKEDLAKTCCQLQTQVAEMEHFLSDYGLMWVGDDEDSDGVKKEVAEEEQSQSAEGAMWHPASSAVAGLHVNFDLVLRNIRQLNLLAGEGESFVQATAIGAQLATREPVQLRLYSNGIVMFEGPFRSHQEPSTQRCLQDLADGYFPSELQERYPDGVPFEVHDNRHQEFIPRPLMTEFSGKGLAVGAVNNTVSSVPGRKLTREQFLSRLPKVVVKGGKVIDIRSSVEETLKGSSGIQNSPMNFIDTAALRAVNTSESRADDVTTLRVRSEDGNHIYLLKMHVSETIGHLREYLDKHRRKAVQRYDIISAFPQQCYSDDSRTLSCCGLTPSATVLLRPQKGSLQSTGPFN